MRKRRVAVVSFVALLCLLVFPVTSVFSQNSQSSVEIRDVDGGLVPTPVYTVKRTQTSNKAGEWFRAVVSYDTAADWTDEISFTFYVRVRGKSRDVPPVSLFKGETSFIHIPKGRGHEADMFLHPNIINRFGEVDAIAVEVRMGGRIIARTGKPRPKDAWWEKISPTGGVLLNRSQTPFTFINLDMQEIIKPARN